MLAGDLPFGTYTMNCVGVVKLLADQRVSVRKTGRPSRINSIAG